MNYRQWKKNYKKQHGYNPPMKEDKRKQRKAAAQEASIAIPVIIETFKNMIPALTEGMAIYFESLSEASAQVAKNLRGGSVR